MCCVTVTVVCIRHYTRHLLNTKCQTRQDPGTLHVTSFSLKTVMIGGTAEWIDHENQTAKYKQNRTNSKDYNLFFRPKKTTIANGCTAVSPTGQKKTWPPHCTVHFERKCTISSWKRARKKTLIYRQKM